MANKEHVKILRSGVNTWNQWRIDNPQIVPDLTDAILTRANLYKANLASAILTEAILTSATLRGANLSKANLSGAILSGADLSGANLTDANLTIADLSGANQSDVDLSRANLSRADLRRANLSKANLSGTNLSGTNLNRANLSGVNLNKANLSDIKSSVFEYYRRNASEVNQWLTYLKNGKVDGSQYVGDCCCLIGTIAKIKGVNYQTIKRDAYSPCERFLEAVEEGDTPENHPVAQVVYDWGIEFLKEEATRLKNMESNE